ncbi:ferredoxin [Synoicihabitans lomoniglobus]|uniref:Ferredoxin n=1 Tax=Synoicihabitans lomoniglobus TaxID=2909285 RepID=A0AAF0I2V4_9BACT|nr:ferredoxin [Opitutaceae bacterium LMO-M01]WED65968.1 ferredoxin [Opitutaceae bacterium LMO-M01]
MASVKYKWPQNVPGEFYVDECCLDHHCCAEIAPDHFRRIDDGGHLYVYRQPSNPEERARCMAALDTCPMAAIGCDGVPPKLFSLSWWRRILR